MIAQFKSQCSELITASEQIDERRRFSKAVLSSVIAAVIGVDDEGYITIINRSAEAMFSFDPQKVIGQSLIITYTTARKVFEVVRASAGKTLHEQQQGTIYQGRTRVYNVQITIEDTDAKNHSWIVIVDGIINLIEAQHSSICADIARRIAHEIKNPLTLIQLSVERLHRRYGKIIDIDKGGLTSVLIRLSDKLELLGGWWMSFHYFASIPKISTDGRT